MNLVPTRIFFDPKFDEELSSENIASLRKDLPPSKIDCKPMSDEEIRSLVRQESELSPFNNFIGNVRPVEKLGDSAFSALTRYDHQCRENYAILGPSSCGKTTLIRLYADIIQIPLIEISPKCIKKLDDLFRVIKAGLELSGLYLTASKNKPKHWFLPPCIIFLDEVHALADNIVQGLLKPVEPKDGILHTESGNFLDCRKASWFIATTDEGLLFDAFRNRFNVIRLKAPSKNDIIKIIKLNEKQYKDQIDDEEVLEFIAVCNRRVPRKALAFARQMHLKHRANRDKSWTEISKLVAENEGLDEFGMDEVLLKILKILNEGPVPKNNMASILNIKSEEIERYLMPSLMIDDEDQKSLVTTTTKGYTITEAGREEVRRRYL